MTSILIAIHVAVCIFLILVVLLQTGKGAEMGVSMGGAGSQALFGAAGPANILTKITTAVAIIFMVTSLTLAYMSGHQSQSSVMKGADRPGEQQEPASK
ncbi:preprotein translocase subunit SecG [Desulfobacter vibrioformis]|uniref:preprotein translocase subunit SecG n=1 Tax=Desulfobacter vibrioformis TaxID=34031 RepID=UPI00054E4136|nr:preprotein translocase subunit SecG [Desulfobacter vibrioformis]